MKKTKLSCILAGIVLAAAGSVASASVSTVLIVGFQGPGGHSNGAYGRTNAVHAAARTISEIIAVLPDGKSYNMTGFGGGNSVNSIASDGMYKIRLTAADQAQLDALKATVETAIKKGVKAENDFRGVKEGDMTGGVPANIRYTIETEVASAKPVIEFYHAAFDHYFVTQDAKEISDLDTGVHKGWARTGQQFYAFEPGKSASEGKAICRFYGKPEAGLDSHFYPAPTEACAVSKPEDWIKETENAFEVLLPDASYKCPTGTTPIYRFWNNRKDSNHRYVTTEALAQEMANKGYVYEGAHWLAPIMCSSQ